MDSPLVTLTDEILASLRRLLLRDPTPQQQALFAALSQHAQDVSTATTNVAWNTAIAGWHIKLDEIAAEVPGTANGQALIASLMSQQLPPIPGVADLLSLVAGKGDSLSRELAFGPAVASIDLPAVKLRFSGDPPTVPETLAAFRPPSGFGVALDAGPARGGGHVRFESEPHRRFLGSLGVTLGVLEVAAFALLDVLPEDRYSLAVLLSARFSPGIQLSFGFAITGIGGLIGLDREIDVEQLQARFLSGAVVNALFADDPTANAPIILDTLNAILPPKAGSFVVGPTLQISWLQIGSYTFFNFGLAVLIELPGPARALLVGSARAEIPGPGVPLLYLRADASGTLDFVHSLVAIDAVLVNSRILEIFRITGSAAFRVNWGARPYSVVTIGGFYPGFNPEPATFPSLQRVGMVLDSPLPGIYLRFEAYVAATPNTFQLGGLLEAGLQAGPVGAGGHLKIDAILQYDPFRFQANFNAGFSVKFKGRTFAGVQAQGIVSGPAPVVVRARFAIEVLLFEISFDHTFTLGQSDNSPARAVPNLFEYLRPELTNPTNLRAEGGDDRYVALQASRITAVGGKAVLPNHGQLIWEQKRVPLDHLVERVDNVSLDSPAGARVRPLGKIASTAVETDFFSPGTFLNLRTDSERLNQPQFEALPSGVRVTFQQDQAPFAEHEVHFLEFYRPGPWGESLRSRLLLPSALLGALGATGEAPAIGNVDAKFSVSDESWASHPGSQKAASQTAAHQSVRGNRNHAALPLTDVVDLGAVP